MDQLTKWRCLAPDRFSTPEYRAVYDTLSRGLSSVTADSNVRPSAVALASLKELIFQAEAFRRRIAAATGIRPTRRASRGRVEILNWRKHGDDESYCRVEVFSADDSTQTTSFVEEEYSVRAGAEDEGDYGATYYVNDDITIADGDIMISRDGRRFQIGVVLAE